MASANDIVNQARAWLGKNEVDGSFKEITVTNQPVRAEQANACYEYLSGKPPEPPTSKQSKLPIWAYCRLF